VSSATLLHPSLTESATRAPAANPRKSGVLVVDDEPTVRMVLNLCLRSAGFAVWQAAGGREALEVYRARRAEIDVVLLDVRMPHLDGPRTFAALREINPEVRCCFMSGDAGEYTVGELLAAGAVGFLSKPFRVADVEALVRQAVRGREP
jgi:CheY-like chemotaxis protein